MLQKGWLVSETLARNIISLQDDMMFLTIGAEMPRTATDYKAKLFRGLSDPSRLALLEALRNGPTSVSELVELTGLSQPNVSNHLCCLKECELVVGEQKGKFVFYRLNGSKIAALMETADALLSELSDGFCQCKRYE